MKTIVVLFAVVAVAFGAPSFTEKDTKSDSWADTIRRDKKSSQGFFFAESAPVNLADSQIHHNSEIDSALLSPSARTFGSKKHTFTPTIIKNHHGYQLYRNSEEERAQADPLEDCSKQVKVKLCDKQNKESKVFERSVKENANVQEDNMKSRIKMAKEALEDIQRELKNKEQNPKSAGWKQREAESDAKFEQDIDVAWKALDHIHRNFGNLESMSLRKEPISHQEHETIKRNDMQRVAQWKENIDTMNKNVEVGRNIEDSLQFANQQSGLKSEPIDTTKLMRNSMNHEMSTKADTTVISKKHIAGTEINKDQHMKDDMNIAATSLDSKVQKPEQHHQQNLNAKSTDPATMKAAEHHDNNDKKSSTPLESINKSLLPNVDDIKMKAADNLEKLKPDEHFQKNAELELNHNSNMEFNQQKKPWVDAKSSEHSAGTLEKKPQHMEEKLSSNFETSEKIKSAEPEKELNNHEMQIFSSKIEENQHQKAANIDVPPMSWAGMNTENMENNMQSKTAHEFHKGHLNGMHMHTIHHKDTHFAPSHHHHMGIHHPHHVHFTKIHEHPHHAKSSDMDETFQPNLQMNLGDFSEKSAMENSLQWAQKQDGGRSAYGPYGGAGYGSGGGSGAIGGSGAVGVFPNAHVGGCAVPLLLSCSPSVVSGSLAKSGYGHTQNYGSPAYKSAGENTHTKRNIKKTNEIAKEKLSHKTLKSKAIVTEKKM